MNANTDAEWRVLQVELLNGSGEYLVSVVDSGADQSQRRFGQLLAKDKTGDARPMVYFDMFLSSFQRESAVIEVSKGKLSARLSEAVQFDDNGNCEVTLNLQP